MVMMLIGLGAVALSAYVWMTRGFFSALIHLVCSVAAGAIAFGVWEPLAYAILNAAPDRGAMGNLLVNNAWALSLGVPFAIALAILRGVVDTILPANAQCAKAIDYAGGAVCGALSGIIVGGILVLSLGFLRVGSDFAGYALAKNEGTTSRGSIEKNTGVLVPWVDQWTARFFSYVSTRSLATGTPLAAWHPDFALLPATMRLTYENASRTSLKPSAFEVTGWYTVGDAARGGPMDQLLRDGWNPAVQQATDVRAQPLPPGYLAGFVVKFNAGAREVPGYISVGNGQVRLAVTSDDGESRAIHPVAVVTNQDDAARIAYQRFRFDYDKAFFASIGAASETVMAFEFPVPTGFRPLALYVKGVRYTVPQGGATAFATVAARDTAVAAGNLPGLEKPGQRLDPSTGDPVQVTEVQTPIDETPVRVDPSLGFSIQRGSEGALSTQQTQRGSWEIIDGEAALRLDQVGRRVDRQLSIDRFGVTPDKAVVQVNFTPMRRQSMFGQALDMAERTLPPVLVDTNGQTYQAVGYVYKDTTTVRVRFTQATPLRALSEAPSVGRNDPSREITLLFVVSNGVQITELRLGGKTIERYEPPIDTQGGVR